MKTNTLRISAALALAALVFFIARCEHAQTTNAEKRVLLINPGHTLEQIGLALRTWSGDHGGNYPWNVSTNAGGSREFSAPDADGFDANSFRHFQVMSNELETTKLLVCPPSGATPAKDFASLQPDNVSFRIHIDPAITPANASGNKTPMVVAPDGSTLCYDGSIKLISWTKMHPANPMPKP